MHTQADVVDPAKNSLPNPNPTVIKGWGALPDGRVWGSTAGVDIGPDGNVWAYDRCGTNTLRDSNLAPIFKFNRSSGKVLASFGGGMIVFPARTVRGQRWDGASDDTLTLKTANGQTLEFSLGADTTYASKTPATAADVKAGSKVEVQLQAGGERPATGQRRRVRADRHGRQRDDRPAMKG